MTAWERERWRKLYLREPSDQEVLPWQTRGLRDLLIRLADDDGKVARDLSALRRRLRADSELDEHVVELLRDGFLVALDGGIYVRNLPAVQGREIAPRARQERTEAIPATGGGRWGNTTREQRAEAAKRAADARWRRTGDASGDASCDASSSHPVTHDDASPDASGDACSPRAVSGSSDPSESIPEEEKREEENHQSARARDASSHDALTHRRMTHDASEPGGGDRLRLDYVSECPPNLVELCRAAGLIASLAKQHGASEADVEQVIVDYRDHFIKGRGFGEKRRLWFNQVRGKVLDVHRSARLVGAAKVNVAEEGAALTPEAAARRDARLARQKAASERHQAELVKAHGDAPARDLGAVRAGIGGADG